ncbi:MAG: hypothetical protein K2X32_08900, partial [Phycisphaerales bacterium]|nr:hypothetical protein [Phycisphaerales bacterium]
MLTLRSTALKSVLLTLIVFATTLLGAPNTVQAQCFEGWLPGQGVPGVRGTVRAQAILPGGDVIVGGDFTIAGSVEANDIARYNPTTGVWSALASGIHEFGYVSALAVLPGGDVIVGGTFTTAGGVAASNIARFNPTTGVWSAMGSGVTGGGDYPTVKALAVLPGGDVIVGGDFTIAGSVEANDIARYNPTTGVWSALGYGVYGFGTETTVNSMAVLPGGDVLVGGAFVYAGDVVASNIARYNPTTGIWSALGSGVGSGLFGDEVRALAVLPGGDIIVGGTFYTAGFVLASNIARYNFTEDPWEPSYWSALGSGTSNDVYALAVLLGGDVIVGGSFTSAGGVAGTVRIARVNPSTGDWSALGSGTDNRVEALAVLPGGDVIVGGLFNIAAGVGARNIARYNPTTGVWSALGSGTNESVTALAVLPGGDVIVGGGFTTAGGVSANNIARYNPTTGVWSALGSGTSIFEEPGWVIALVVLPGGDVIVGGRVTFAGGVQAGNIARYIPTTGVWS